MQRQTRIDKDESSRSKLVQIAKAVKAACEAAPRLSHILTKPPDRRIEHASLRH